MAHEQNGDWQSLSREAQQILADSIPREWRLSEDQLPPPDQPDVRDVPRQCGILTENELAITESSATDIVRRVARGEWSAETVARAFCKRAAVAHQLVNCLTVCMFPEALARARELDAYFAASGGKTVGPLHGLPVSLKDNFNVAGKPSSVGFCGWALQGVEAESTIVGILRELGAVLYVKTNVPTAMMIAETVNNCYGRTVNPQHRAFTSGGSSGGESALIALCGSPLGVGTDIGGSLRIPAACTGIYTLRPSYGRFPHFDARSGMAGQESVGSVHGPMARSLADLRLFTDHVAAASPWLRDPKCIPMPWRPVELKARPKIAVLWHNGIVQPTPPVARALCETAATLRAKGYELVDWDAQDLHITAMQILGEFFVADGGRSVQRILDLSGEPWRPELADFARARELGVSELWAVQQRRTALQKAYLDRWAAEAGLDAILGPTAPYAVPKNGHFRSVSYTGVFNVLDYSATSFPTGMLADKGVDVYPEDFKAWGTDDQAARDDYDAEATHGMPISLQLTCRRLEDEKVMALTERVCRDIA